MLSLTHPSNHEVKEGTLCLCRSYDESVFTSVVKSMKSQMGKHYYVDDVARKRIIDVEDLKEIYRIEIDDHTAFDGQTI